MIYVLGGLSNFNGCFDVFNLDGSYWYCNIWGVMLDLFVDNGCSDVMFYGDVGKLDICGGMIEVDWNLFG